MSAAEQATAPEPFNRRTIFWGIFASLLAAAGFFLLSTYAPDFRLGKEGGVSALSKSGAGFAGLVKLMTLAGDPPVMARDDEALDSSDLLIVTISPETSLEALEALVERRVFLPTLFVLPKWVTIPSSTRQGWEMRTMRLPPDLVENRLRKVVEKVRIGDGPAAGELRYFGRVLAAPAELQWVVPAGARTLISAGPDKAVMIALEDEQRYMLADPDLMNNAGLKDRRNASAALAIIDALRPADAPVMFDLTLHGAGQRTHDLSKLLIEPPFLALTLTILAAAALAVLHGLGRFGPARPDERAIPFGKRALVDTTATLLRRAGRLDGLGGRYALLMKSRAAALLGAPGNLKGEALDQWLDAIDKDGTGGITVRLAAAGSATDEKAMVPAALRLHDWIARRSGERR